MAGPGSTQRQRRTRGIPLETASGHPWKSLPPVAAVTFSGAALSNRSHVVATETTTTSAKAWAPDAYYAATDAVPSALILTTSTVAGQVDGDAPVVRVAYGRERVYPTSDVTGPRGIIASGEVGVPVAGCELPQAHHATTKSSRRRRVDTRADH